MKTFLLHIETATPICSVCLSNNKTLVAKAQSKEPNSHAKILATLIQKVLSESGISANNLSAVCVSEGPGSYTGLRIGLSTAKGICYASGVPLILVPTMAAMAQGIKRLANDASYLLPVLDARRNDVYFSIFDSDLKELITQDCKSVNEVSYLLENKKIRAIAAGTGIEKFVGFEHNISLLEANVVDAENMIPLATKKFLSKDFADLAYSEPVYRK